MSSSRSTHGVLGSAQIEATALSTPAGEPVGVDAGAVVAVATIMTSYSPNTSQSIVQFGCRDGCGNTRSVSLDSERQCAEHNPAPPDLLFPVENTCSIADLHNLMRDTCAPAYAERKQG